MSIYNQKIFKHLRHPKNKGRLDAPDKVFEGFNPYCGDRLVFDVLFSDEGVIKQVGWHGAGCTISQASASIFSEQLIGKTLDDVMTIAHQDCIAALDIELSPSRIKCALLPLYTLKQMHDVE